MYMCVYVYVCMSMSTCIGHHLHMHMDSCTFHGMCLRVHVHGECQCVRVSLERRRDENRRLSLAPMLTMLSLTLMSTCCRISRTLYRVCAAFLCVERMNFRLLLCVDDACAAACVREKSV